MTLTMRPAVPDASIERAAARQHRKAVFALASIISSKTSGSASPIGAMAKAAGQVDRGPKVGTRRHRRRRQHAASAEVDIGHQLHPVMPAKAKSAGHGRMAARHMADRALSSSLASTAPPSAPVPPVTTICLSCAFMFNLRTAASSSVDRDLDEIRPFAAPARAAGLRRQTGGRGKPLAAMP